MGGGGVDFGSRGLRFDGCEGVKKQKMTPRNHRKYFVQCRQARDRSELPARFPTSKLGR